MQFQFTIETYPQTRSVGQSLETDMQNAARDCPALWQAFGPRIATELVPQVEVPTDGHTYGISRMIDEKRFYYSATLEVSSIKSLPEQMQEIVIPGGLYVKCSVPSLAHIQAAYEAMYMEWPQTQQAYEFDLKGLCFERYPLGADMDTPFELYAAVKKCNQ